jgi:hypothetical protein
MRAKLRRLIWAVGIAMVLSGSSPAADAQEPFYKGKTIRPIVRLSAEGVTTFIRGLLPGISDDTFPATQPLLQKA